MLSYCAKGEDEQLLLQQVLHFDFFIACRRHYSGSLFFQSRVYLYALLGIGVKYKIKERLNVGFEFTMRKSFGDKLDGLSDLYGVKHTFAKNTEWYSMALFTLTWEFSKRCTKCHYVE